MSRKTTIFLYVLAFAIAIAIIIYYRKNFPQNVTDMIDTVASNLEDKVFSFLVGAEGYEPVAVHEPTDRANVFTIGYGSIYNWDAGRAVQLGDRIDEPTAHRWLLIEADKDIDTVNSSVTVDINQNQVAALAAFTYNVGISAFQNSTLLKLLNAGTDKNTVAAEFDKWVYSDGKVNKGLINRQKKQKALFLS